ncbi:hypothetical protein DSO57_1036284 [Entomophthora muscae]|uniref:Uncharacterized protein n=1 Tax=Entomophthora muscae TaxID=34485 RepID=A0ACC2SNP3_9FUNG|nr:hypothetical protein DSO57_1036284 [Entomophthora muscae]
METGIFYHPGRCLPLPRRRLPPSASLPAPSLPPASPPPVTCLPRLAPVDPLPVLSLPASLPPAPTCQPPARLLPATRAPSLLSADPPPASHPLACLLPATQLSTWALPATCLPTPPPADLLLAVTVENQMKGITRPRKTRNQQRTATKPLREIDGLNAVIDKKQVKAGVAQIALENLDLPYFYPNNYDKKITCYTLFDDGST